MVARPTPTTLTDTVDLMIVVVGGPDTLVDAARRCGRSLDVGVATASLNEAATAVAECRPFAVLISTDVYALDCPEFDALALDVGARLIPVETHGHAERIAKELDPLLMAAAKTHGHG